jgi:hypothetical protein
MRQNVGRGFTTPRVCCEVVNDVLYRVQLILPPKTGPWRPIQMSLLLCSLVGLAFCGVALTSFREHDVSEGPCAFACLGMLYFVCGYFVKRLHVWALYVALFVTIIGLLFWIALFLFSLAMPSTVIMFAEVAGILLAEMLGFIFIGLLIRSLALSFEAIEILGREAGRGFDVVPTQEQEEDSEGN